MRQTRLAGAKLMVRYFCDYKPVGRKGEPLNDYLVVEIPIDRLIPYDDYCTGDNGIKFEVKCTACGRKHTFDLDIIKYANEGIDA